MTISSPETAPTQAPPITADGSSNIGLPNEKIPTTTEEPDVALTNGSSPLKDASRAQELSPRELHGIKVPTDPNTSSSTPTSDQR